MRGSMIVGILGVDCLALLPSAFATPDLRHHEEARKLDISTHRGHIEARACSQDASLCGWNGLCCTKDEVCYTDANNNPQCGPANEIPPQPWSTLACSASQSPCGSLCCDVGYYCIQPGVCYITNGAPPTTSRSSNLVTILSETSTTSSLDVTSSNSGSSLLAVSSSFPTAGTTSATQSTQSGSRASATGTPLSTGSGNTNWGTGGYADLVVGMGFALQLL